MQRVLSRPSLVAYYIIQICPEKNTRLNFKGMKKSTNTHTHSPWKSRSSLLAFFKVAPISVPALPVSEIYICPVSREFASRPRRRSLAPFVSCSISHGNPLGNAIVVVCPFAISPVASLVVFFCGSRDLCGERLAYAVFAYSAYRGSDSRAKRQLSRIYGRVQFVSRYVSRRFTTYIAAYIAAIFD